MSSKFRPFFWQSCITWMLFFDVVNADWPAFRGPNGDGVASADTRGPLAWSPDKNIRWRVPLPQPGNGSPIVVAGRVLVTSAEDAGGQGRSLYCFDAADGKQQWVQTVSIDRVMPTHKTNPYGATTPASDGKVVVVWHGSAGLHAYTLAGELLWHRDLGEFRHLWGYASSPIIVGDQVILNTGPGKENVFVAAFELANGKTRWQTDEPFTGDGEYNAQKQYLGSWATPVVAGGQVIVSMPTRINAYDPQDGNIIWSCSGIGHDRGELAYSSPTMSGDICFATGGFRGPMLAVKIDGKGDVTERRLYRVEKQPQSIGSAVAVDGFLYRPNAGPGSIECIEALTGKITWKERSLPGDYWASIIQVGPYLYATNQEAETTIFKPRPERFEQVAVNRLGGRCNATPAASDNALFFRTFSHLIRVQE